MCVYYSYMDVFVIPCHYIYDVKYKMYNDLSKSGVSVTLRHYNNVSVVFNFTDLLQLIDWNEHTLRLSILL